MFVVASTLRRTQQFFGEIYAILGSSWTLIQRTVDNARQFGATCPCMDPKQARFPGVAVAWYERAAKVENQRRADAGLSSRVTWGDLVRVAACQLAGLPVEYEIDFAWIREEMKKSPTTKRSKRT